MTLTHPNGLTRQNRDLSILPIFELEGGERLGVRAAHARGAAVVAWTVDHPTELERLAGLGVNAVVTNDPRIFAPETMSTLPA